MRSVLLATCALAAACGGPENKLEGSIGESYSLAFQRVAIRQQGDYLLIEYQRDAAGGTEKVCKVVLDTRGATLKADSSVTGDDFLARVTVSRVALTGGDFPAVERGSLHFDKLVLQDRGPAEGSFDVVFVGGYSLHGEFAGGVAVVPTS